MYIYTRSAHTRSNSKLYYACFFIPFQRKVDDEWFARRIIANINIDGSTDLDKIGSHGHRAVQ